MRNYITQSGKRTYNLNSYVVDTEDEVDSLPTTCAMGSTAKVIASGNVYMLNGAKEWILQPSTSGGSSSGSSSGDEGDITVLGETTSDSSSIVIL